MGVNIMASLEFSQQEIDMLNKIVKSYLSELRMEIADTDQLSFKKELRKEEELLNKLIEKLDSNR
jgi:hypothetical protein